MSNRDVALKWFIRLFYATDLALHGRGLGHLYWVQTRIIEDMMKEVPDGK